MSKKFSIAPLLYIPILACGGGGTTHQVLVDGHGSGSGSGSNVTCEALASYTTALMGQDAINIPATAGSGSAMGTVHQEYFLGGLDAANPGDFLDIELYAAFGGFGSADIAPGTYALLGDEIDWNTCGACVLIWPKLAFGSDGSLTGLTADYTANHQYMASSGSITLSSVAGSGSAAFAGSITGVQFKHINLDPNTGDQTYPDTCVSSIASATFSTTLKQGSAAGFVAEGATDTGVPIRLHLRNRHR